MRKWKVKLPGGKMFEMETNDPGRDLIAQGHTAFALEEILPPPVELPRSGKDHPMMLTVDQLAKELQIGRGTAYTLCHRADFPVTRIGRNVRINREGLQDWLNKNNGGILL